jgi:hypothetical protein
MLSRLSPRLTTLVLNERLTVTDHFKKVCQKVYWILLSLRLDALHTPFEGGRRLVVLVIMPHIGYGGIVYASVDAASQRRLNMALRAFLWYINSLRRLDYVSHLETSVMGASLADYARIQLLFKNFPTELFFRFSFVSLNILSFRFVSYFLKYFSFRSVLFFYPWLILSCQFVLGGYFSELLW